VRPRTIIIDNYDSFTYNLAQYLEELGSEVLVLRNDETDVAGIRALSATHLVISPGPGGPDDAGVSCQVVSELAGEIPMLGVCLGHQVIGQVLGGRVVRGPEPVHGKTSDIYHDGHSIFTGLPNPLEATRYHSLVVDRDSIPGCLEVTSTTADGLVMGLRHRDLPIEGVQFHPESVLTVGGKRILENFLSIDGDGALHSKAGETAPPRSASEELRDALGKLAAGGHLDRYEARHAALAMLAGDAPDAVIAAILIALKVNGETGEEIAGFAEAMREVKVSLSPKAERLVDTCGTGGDGMRTFNISTTAGIIAAACGVSVAKHGNRSVSSRCGSADVLEALGVDIGMSPDRVCECIDSVGIGFMFAPAFHPAMKRVMETRKQLAMPTIFNILGPLVNPAGARAQVLGVNRADLVPVVGRVLAELGCERGFVLHGMDGMDEFTLTRETAVCEVRSGSALGYVLTPEDLGLSRRSPELFAGGNVRENARITREVIAGREGPHLEMSVANAAFAIIAGGASESLREGLAMARSAVEEGRAARVLERLIEFSNNGGGRVPR
jgi:anthranilate synthase/phosphoribosyltransferase